MVLDMNYWIKVLKRVAVLAISVVLVFLSFKLAIFYMPFLVAFIISLIIAIFAICVHLGLFA